MSQLWKDGYQIWKSLVEATGRTDHSAIDFLERGGGTKEVKYAEEEPFITKDHRTLRKIDLPDPILDEVKRVRNGRP